MSRLQSSSTRLYRGVAALRCWDSHEVSQIAVTQEYIYIYIDVTEALWAKLRPFFTPQTYMFEICAFMSLIRSLCSCIQIERAPTTTPPKWVVFKRTDTQISTHERIQTFTKSLREVIEERGYVTRVLSTSQVNRFDPDPTRSAQFGGHNWIYRSKCAKIQG